MDSLAQMEQGRPPREAVAWGVACGTAGATHLPPELPADFRLEAWEMVASGYAAVWATENTREAIFDAMKRKEVYATTGTRIRVRVFAGWDFTAEEVQRPDFAREGYKRGVPMGGDLGAAPTGKAPRFMVRALRDPDGANLDRVQIIKGWLDSDGKTHERVFDVAVSDGRTIGPDGRCTTPVGDTVDVDEASFTNTIGDALLEQARGLAVRAMPSAPTVTVVVEGQPVDGKDVVPLADAHAGLQQGRALLVGGDRWTAAGSAQTLVTEQPDQHVCAVHDRQRVIFFVDH